MSDIQSKLKEENEFIKELMNFYDNEIPLKRFEEGFTNFIKNSKNDLKFFIDLLDFYSTYRPHQHGISKELVECVCSCFPEQTTEIQQYIKSSNSGITILKFIMFPEEFPMNKGEQQDELFLLLQKDDIVGFISFLSQNPTIDITEKQKLALNRYYFYLFNYYSISLIDFCGFFGSFTRLEKISNFSQNFSCEIR